MKEYSPICGKINPYFEEQQEEQLKNLIANMRKKVRVHFSKEKELFDPIFTEMKRIILDEKQD